MARHDFGGDIAAYVITKGDSQAAGSTAILTPGATVTFYSAQSGGSQHTDLQDLTGVAISSVTSDSNGSIPQLRGPDGVWAMWADANGGNGPRNLMIATDVGEGISAAQSQANQAASDLASLVLTDLSNVDAGSPADGDALVWSASQSTWVPAAGGGSGVSVLDDLADVDAGSPSDGNALTWDSATGTWVPAAAGGSGTVETINGEGPDAEGDVALSASDVGALSDSYTAPVSSVDGLTGTVDLSSSYATPSYVDTAEADAKAYTDTEMDVHRGPNPLNHRVRNADGTWPARASGTVIDEAFETDYTSPAFPGDSQAGDLYIGPSGMV